MQKKQEQKMDNKTEANPQIFENKYLWFFIAVFVVVLAIGLIKLSVTVKPTRADVTTPSATIGNVVPVASSVKFNPVGGISSGDPSDATLTENTTTTVYCSATVTDNNGCGDVTDSIAYLYRTDIGTSGCDTPGEADTDQCYYAAAAACAPDGVDTCSGGSDYTVTYACSVPMQYYADPTDPGSYYNAQTWKCSLVPSDESTGTGAESSTGKEVNTLTALDITSTINYGTLALGADTGASNQTTVVTDTGNTGIDSNLQGTAMTCTTGSITVGYQEYSNAAFTWGVGGTDLTGGDVELDLDVVKRDSTGGNDYTKEIYWGLGVPSSGVEGACSGTNTATGVADPNCNGVGSCD